MVLTVNVSAGDMDANDVFACIRGQAAVWNEDSSSVKSFYSEKAVAFIVNLSEKSPNSNSFVKRQDGIQNGLTSYYLGLLYLKTRTGKPDKDQIVKTRLSQREKLPQLVKAQPWWDMHRRLAII